eukprot:PhF_6_TR33030/c0_g1_i1/m.48693
MSQGFTYSRRTVNNLKMRYDNYGIPYTSWRTPYEIWSWKQSEMYRQVYEGQMEHLRKVYARQWYEAYRINADEYLSVYSRTKAAQYATWEQEMKLEDAKRREKFYEAQARQQLKAKQRDILREFYEKQFFFWYERSAERLQQMDTLIPWVTRDNMSQHIEKELKKYTTDGDNTASTKQYPLNFVGQMPMIETSTGDIAEVPYHASRWYQFTENDPSVRVYGSDKSDISADIEAVNVSTAKVTAEVQEQMEKEAGSSRAGGDDATKILTMTPELKRQRKETKLARERGVGTKTVLKRKPSATSSTTTATTDAPGSDGGTAGP